MPTTARSWLGAWLVLAGCGPGDGDGTDPLPTDSNGTGTGSIVDTDGDTDPVVDTDPPTDTDTEPVPDPPTIVAAALRDPGPSVKYAKWLDVETDVPSTVHVEWRDGGHALQVDAGEQAQRHEIAVIGLRPEGTYEITVVATDAEGERSAPTTLTLEVEPLVNPFPKLEIIRHDPARMEPGFTLMQLGTDIAAYVVAFDDELQPVWLTLDPSWQDVRRTRDGTLFGTHAGEVVEQDFLGEVVRRYDDQNANAYDIPYTFLHHEAYPLDDGSFLSLGMAWRDVPNYPVDYADPDGPRAPGRIRSTLLTHIARDGTVLANVDTADVLDVTRVGFDSISRNEQPHDWDHGNAIVPDDEAGWFVASLRHQGAVIKVSERGDLAWILADPAGWPAELRPLLLTPVGEPFVWSYHQHHPDWHGDRLVLLDNHNYGHTPYSPPPPQPPHARVVEYEIDEQLLTVKMIGSWDRFTTGDTMVSGAVGSAMRLPTTGNLFADFGWVTEEGGVDNATNGRGFFSVRLVEFAASSPDDPALDIRMFGTVNGRPFGWTSYRATRIPLLGRYVRPAPR